MFLTRTSLELDDDVDLDYAATTPCEETYCGVKWRPILATATSPHGQRHGQLEWMGCLGVVLEQRICRGDDGHISNWDTSGVTDMSWLFCGNSAYCGSHYKSGVILQRGHRRVDTSGVTRMDWMSSASAFDQDLAGAWATT